MYCTKCGMTILNGERQCKQCGADLQGHGAAVMTERRLDRPVTRPVSRLAVAFLALSLAGLAALAGAWAMVWLIGREPAGSAASWNLGLIGLGLLTVGFLLDCSAVMLGVLAALRLKQSPRLKGRRLALAGAIALLAGVAIFCTLRTNPIFHPPAVPLVSPTANPGEK